MADLETPYTAPVPNKLGSLSLVLSDANGTVGGMSGKGEVRLMDASGNVIEVRQGDPSNFMPAAWKSKVKDVLDELRAEVAIKLGVSAS